MSRIALTRPRRNRAVWDRPATGTRLLPTPHSRLDHSLRRGIPLALSRVEGSQERNGWGLLPSPPQHTNHYKRCLQAERLRPGSDQSLSHPVPVAGYGRFPDKNRLALGKGPCQVRAPLTRRIRFASSGDAHEHGVMSLPRAIAPPWAIAPFSDSPGLDLAGESEQSDNLRLKTNAPFKDSTVVTTGEHPTTNAGHGSPLPSLRVVEHFWWSGLPHTENFSALLHILSEVRGKDSTVVTTGLLPTTNGGHGSPLPSLRVVEHFWWTGLPHAENFSGLVHIPSEVRGCPQGRRRCEPSPGADTVHRYRRRRLPAQPSGTFHPLPLPFSPSFLRRQVADAPRREPIPGREGAPLLGAYPPLPPTCPFPQ